MIHAETKEFEWDVKASQQAAKSADWYWTLGILAVTGVVIAVISGNFLLALLIAMGAVLIGFYANHPQKDEHVEISERGVSVNGEMYDYADITAFWMKTDESGARRLLIDSTKAFHPKQSLRVPDDVPAKQVRRFLAHHAKEQEIEESSIDRIAEAIGM